MTAESEKFYRFDDVSYSTWDHVADCIGPSRLVVHLTTYTVTKRTPTGVRLLGVNRFVSCKTNKRFACPTIEEAKESYIARKKRQKRIHEARVHRAEKAIELVNKGDYK